MPTGAILLSVNPSQNNSAMLQLLLAVESADRLRPRDRLSLGLLECKDVVGGGSRGVEVLYKAALNNLVKGNEPLGIRCLLALGELCREVECAELLGAIGGHTTILRLMSDGEIPGKSRLRPAVDDPAAAPGEAKVISGGSPDFIDNSNPDSGNGSPSLVYNDQDGEEDEVQAAVAEVAVRIVSSGCAFPMRAAFPGDRLNVLGRYPLQYDFIVDWKRVEQQSVVNGSRCSTDNLETTDIVAPAEADLPADTVTDDERRISILVRPVKERQHSQFDVGFQMWPAAVILSRWLCAHPEVMQGCSVLEVGAGLGLCGLVAAHLASHVTLSDFNPMVLRALEANVTLNTGWSTATTTQQGERGDENSNKIESVGFDGETAGDVAVAIDSPGRVCVRHLDWDLLHVPDVQSESGGQGPTGLSGSLASLSLGGDGGSDGLDAAAAAADETGRFKYVENGAHFDVIIASDHICQVSTGTSSLSFQSVTIRKRSR